MESAPSLDSIRGVSPDLRQAPGPMRTVHNPPEWGSHLKKVAAELESMEAFRAIEGREHRPGRRFKRKRRSA